MDTAVNQTPIRRSSSACPRSGAAALFLEDRPYDNSLIKVNAIIDGSFLLRARIPVTVVGVGDIQKQPVGRVGLQAAVALLETTPTSLSPRDVNDQQFAFSHGPLTPMVRFDDLILRQ